jgi:hypothetical protein
MILNFIISIVLKLLLYFILCTYLLLLFYFFLSYCLSDYFLVTLERPNIISKFFLTQTLFLLLVNQKFDDRYLSK